jgi:hypothetical protein
LFFGSAFSAADALNEPNARTTAERIRIKRFIVIVIKSKNINGPP